MDREQFRAGIPFHYIEEAKLKPYAFRRWANWKNGDPVGILLYSGVNEANVTKIGYTYFDCYTSVVHKIVKVRIYFKDLYI